MDVFVIPTGHDRYELYCETVIVPADAAAPGGGLVARWRDKVNAYLRSAEERRQRGAPIGTTGTWRERLQDRILAWVAERIAEQRLLWNLQRETAVTLAHPDDITAEQAQTLVRRILQRDYERHRRWVVIDGIALVLSVVVLGPLFLIIPGVANLPALYFGFRVAGHWFSLRGATAGLRRVTWRSEPSPRLTELRALLGVTPRARDARLHEIAGHLRLQHLATFFDRVAVRHA
ncbi:MAG: hypothetical protein AB7P99_07530 [Vicinamibacterales bacterium]